MTIAVSTLRPGLLVSLKTSIKGNVKYEKQMIVDDHDTDDGAREASWETKRRIADAKEHKLATETRSKARATISRVCASSAFGLLCPEDKAGELAEAIAAADALVDEFNSKARLTRIEVYTMQGRIAADDVQAMRAINSEVRDLMEQMERGIGNLNADMVRAAANKARDVGRMLSPQAQARVAEAIEIARSTARQIAKAGETAAAEIDTVAMAAIARQRTAFLDLDGATEVAAPVEAGRAVDMEPVRDVGSHQPEGRQIEL